MRGIDGEKLMKFLSEFPSVGEPKTYIGCNDLIDFILDGRFDLPASPIAEPVEPVGKDCPYNPESVSSDADKRQMAYWRDIWMAGQASRSADFTPEEALAETKRRWGNEANAVFDGGLYSVYGIFIKNIGEQGDWKHWGDGDSFRAAFAQADVKEKG